MHTLCNFLFPATMLLILPWFSKHNLFQMEKSSLLIFLFATTFFLPCNVWRLRCACREFPRKKKGKTIEEQTNAHYEAWRANNLSVTIASMLNRGLVPSPSHVFTNDYVDTYDSSTIIVKEKPRKNSMPNRHNIETEAIYA